MESADPVGSARNLIIKRAKSYQKDIGQATQPITTFNFQSVEA